MANEEKSKTLTDDQIETDRDDTGVGRRGMLAIIGAGAATGALAMAGCAPRAVIVGRPGYVAGGYTDGDSTAGCSDPGGGGRGPTNGMGATGYTDCDTYGQSDSAGYGRGQPRGGGVVVQRPGVIVQQPGVYVQQPGVLVQQPCSGMTDSDPQDRSGCGVRGYRGGGVIVQPGVVRDSPGHGRYRYTDSD